MKFNLKQFPGLRFDNFYIMDNFLCYVTEFLPTTGSLNVNPLNNANFFIILKIHESLFRLNKI